MSGADSKGLGGAVGDAAVERSGGGHAMFARQGATHSPVHSLQASLKTLQHLSAVVCPPGWTEIPQARWTGQHVSALGTYTSEPSQVG